MIVFDQLIPSALNQRKAVFAVLPSMHGISTLTLESASSLLTVDAEEMITDFRV